MKTAMKPIFTYPFFTYSVFRYSAFLFILIAWPAEARQRDPDTGNGVVRIYEWPPKADTVPVEEHVPFVQMDSLTLGFGYRTIRQAPYLTFALEWEAGDSLFSGVNYHVIEEEPVFIESVTLSADVEAVDSGVDFNREGNTARLRLELTELELASHPGLYAFEQKDATWEDVFQDTPDSLAKRLFVTGFRLANLEIESIAFGGSNLLTPPLADGTITVGGARTRRQADVDAGVGVVLDIPVRTGPRPGERRDKAGRTEEPRGDQVGRGKSDDREEASRTGKETTDEAAKSRRKNRGKKDKDDDDDVVLLPAAVVGVAAVAAVAVAGGTIGYYGNTKHAPIGLTAGMVLPEGGVLLQVAVNEAVLDRSAVEPERFVGRIISFYDLFKAPLKPALGLGAMASEFGGDFEYEISVSPGVVGVFGPVLIMGGFDVISGGIDMGFAINFKYRR